MVSVVILIVLYAVGGALFAMPISIHIIWVELCLGCIFFCVVFKCGVTGVFVIMCIVVIVLEVIINFLIWFNISDFNSQPYPEW